jgi:hypothetical protein
VKVCIATPSLIGSTCVEFTRSLTDTAKALTLAGIEMQWRTLVFSNFIHAARNELVKEFLASDYTDLVFADDDIGWPAEGLVKMLLRQVPVVGAICPRRKAGEWNVNLLRADGHLIENDGLLECAYVGTALMCIKREALEQMPRAFDAGYEEAGFIGEDAWFCRQWRRMGGRVWAEPNITITHSGLNAWSGNYRRDHHAD